MPSSSSSPILSVPISSPQSQNTIQDSSSPPSSTNTTPPPTQASTFKPNRNILLLSAGVSFSLLSLVITRRSLARRRLSRFTSSTHITSSTHPNAPAPSVAPSLEAFEALNIATINVLALFMLGTGGAMWYLDINSMADARRLLRTGIGVDVERGVYGAEGGGGASADGLDEEGKRERNAEEEFEEWMASVLSRKEAKESMKKEWAREREREKARRAEGLD